MDHIFLDTETTGFGECRMIELAWKIGAEPVRSLRVKNPIPIEEGATKVHGITEAMLAKLPFFTVHPEYTDLKKIFEDGIVFAHNATFDVKVLAREGIRIGTYIDTQKVAKKIYAHAPNYKLQGLRDYLKLDAVGTAHSAAGDVEVLAALVAQMKSDMEILGIPEDDHLRSMMIASLH